MSFKEKLMIKKYNESLSLMKELENKHSYDQRFEEISLLINEFSKETNLNLKYEKINETYTIQESVIVYIENDRFFTIRFLDNDLYSIFYSCTVNISLPNEHQMTIDKLEDYFVMLIDNTYIKKMIDNNNHNNQITKRLKTLGIGVSIGLIGIVTSIIMYQFNKDMPEPFIASILVLSYLIISSVSSLIKSIDNYRAII